MPLSGAVVVVLVGCDTRAWGWVEVVRSVVVVAVCPLADLGCLCVEASEPYGSLGPALVGSQ